MKATKGNKVYTIDETEIRRYQQEGFDILDENGNVMSHGTGKSVPYETYEAAIKELESLKMEKKATVKAEKKTAEKAE